MEEKDLLFKVGDRLKHVITGEECVMARLIEQVEKKDEEDEGKIVYFYTLSSGLKDSNMYPAETAHGCLTKA
jgi:hypothetical protein